jgi:alkylated DNA nucleotide flippase Atl1
LAGKLHVRSIHFRRKQHADIRLALDTLALSTLWMTLCNAPNQPHQRVISSAGFISPRGDGGLSVQRQREALIAEGVEVITVAGGGASINVHGGGKEKVDLKRYGWFPED